MAKKYPTKLFLKLADHTYVECLGGGKRWPCWGGSSGGTEFLRGTGSTKRADAIAGPAGKSGIKCYLINGVCHQAANRILLAGGVLITARLVRGYGLSSAQFGPYGRVGIWPCHSPFQQHVGVTGELPECQSGAQEKAGEEGARMAPSESERAYLSTVLDLYQKAEGLLRGDEEKRGEMEDFHVSLFQTTAEFQLGDRLAGRQMGNMLEIKRNFDRDLLDAQGILRGEEGLSLDYVQRFEKLNQSFQDHMAETLDADAYEAMFGVERDDRVVLADPAILKEAYGLDIDLTDGGSLTPA